MTGTEWRVDAVPRITDGDSVRLTRSRTIELDGRDYWLSDADPNGVPIRLVWVDTPERGDPAYKIAQGDLAEWVIRLARLPLRVICYESAGWDRLLGDLIDADGNSASQYLIRDRGWPVYGAKS